MILKYIIEDIDAVRKYYPNIDNETFDMLISLDPTFTGKNSIGKYGKWILNLYNRGKMSDEDLSEVGSVLDLFKTFNNRLQSKDLNKYKSVQELSDAIAAVIDDESMLTPRQRIRFHKAQKAGRIVTSARDDYDVVLDTPNFIVYVPNTHEASMYLGKGTKWCTAHENPEYYEDYTQNGHKLYIIKDKSTGERWQFSDDNGDFLDQNDDVFDILQLLTKDKKLSKFFEKFLGVDIIKFDPDEPYLYDGTKIIEPIKNLIKYIIVSDNVKTLSNDVFNGCEKLQKVVLPNTIKKINTQNLFSKCHNLTSVVLPDNLESIGDNMFFECYNLKEIDIPKSVKTIGNRSFCGCNSLNIIIIPNGVTHIGNSAFLSHSLLKINIPNSVRSIGDFSFLDCNKNLVIYTDNKNVIEKLEEEQKIENEPFTIQPLNKFKKESINNQLKLRIRESNI